MAKKESSLNENAHNKKSGARGLMQLLPVAWKQSEMEQDYHKNVFDGLINVEAAVKYLIEVDDYCKRKHPKWNKLGKEDKLKMSLAAYNAGPFNLRKRNWDIKNMKPETKKYVKIITQKI